MKTLTSKSLALICFTALLASCAGAKPLSNNDRILGAQGEMSTKKGDKGNTLVIVKVKTSERFQNADRIRRAQRGWTHCKKTQGGNDL